jgi:hypothetical protein
MRRGPSLVPPIAALLLAGGCPAGKVCEEFPTSVGFQPLEPVSDVDYPAATPTDPHPQAIVVKAEAGIAHAWAHGRGYVHYPLAKVFEALKSPEASLLVIREPHAWNATLGVEPYPISFNVEYTVFTKVTVDWNILYRGGVSQGTEAAPEVIGLRYQKTCGSEYIGEESGSLVAVPLAADPGITQVEMVGWLRAATQGADDVRGTLNDWFANLTAKLATLP